MDELPERLSAEMVRPVKRPPVVLQVVSYVSSPDPPTSLSVSSVLFRSGASVNAASVFVSVSKLVRYNDRSVDVVVPENRMHGTATTDAALRTAIVDVGSARGEERIRTRAIWNCSLSPRRELRLCAR